MKSKVFIFAVIFGMVWLSNSAAQEGSYGGRVPYVTTNEGKNLAGEVSLTPTAANVEGQKAKFNEYRDVRDGVYGAAGFKYESERYFLDFGAADIGYKTQKYELGGGWWGNARFDLSYQEIPHNFTYDAKTFYSGVGGANLTYTPNPPSTFRPNPDVSTWNTFDYSILRKNYGAGVKVEALKPFYFGVSLSRQEKKGLFPLGAAGTSPGGITIELPMPVDFKTDTINLEAGYLQNPLSLALNYSYSEFKNDNSNLNFRNPSTDNTAATTDTVTLPPNNSSYKLDFKGSVRLPLRSKFDLSLATSQAKSDAKLFTSYVSDVTSATSNIGVQGRTGVTLNNLVFNGRVDTQNYGLALTSNPTSFLDGKVFYRYYNTENKSDQITTTDSTVSGGSPFSNHARLFDYSEKKYGMELGFRLPAKLYLIPAYTHVETKRKREDIPKNEDDLYSIELRWSGLEFLVARAGYERLNRKAEFEGTNLGDLELFIRRWDGAAKDQDTYKALVDFFPLESLTVSVGYRSSTADYKDTILGLRKLDRNQFNVDVDYLIGKRVRIFGYFDYEYLKLDQFQRQLTPAGPFDPSSAATSTAFNWTVTETDRNYAYGLGTEIQVIPNKLTLRLQYTYVKSEGFADYAYLLGSIPLPTGRTQDNIDISNLDNYQLRYYLAKVTYNITKSLSLAAGYAYEKYVYDDAQYNGYMFVPTSSTGATLGYLTGAYRNPDYEANIFFLHAAYRF